MFRKKKGERKCVCVCVCACVRACVYVCKRERKRERERAVLFLCKKSNENYMSHHD